MDLSQASTVGWCEMQVKLLKGLTLTYNVA